ncbi:sulfatase [Leptospira perolatii]|uniref:Sulfatase n=1 Tax=Leptospira perolatii TaxID=2023191 RepID=A0A2M9ZNB5_9LEPT|nr:sulfatase-like hydrolase/transferase [Leptospira perolatii]PJZ69573.1 sulfatase [Leptospira perolatii]PJZ73560.1 sulfatase [Leptospira perolatii]
MFGFSFSFLRQQISTIQDGLSKVKEFVKDKGLFRILHFFTILKIGFKNGNPWIHSFVFVLILSVLCLVGNTSLHIMGVDVSEFISSFYSMIPLLVKDWIYVVFVSYSFFAVSCVLLLGPDWEESMSGKKIPKWYLYSNLVFLLFLIFCTSAIRYPQLYGEFFFYRHKWASPFLYFLTDWIPPQFPLFLLSFVLFIQSVRRVLQFYFQKERERILYFAVFLLFFSGFHYLGSATGVLLAGIAYSILTVRPKRELKIFALLGLSVLIGLVSFQKYPLAYGIHANQRIQENKEDSSKNSKEGILEYPNILIISADSVRQDQLGFVSGRESFTPNIDLLALDSWAFQDHHTTIPRTFPAWADLLSGRFSFDHGILDMFPDRKDRSALGSRIATLPFLLQEKGYSTSVVSSFAGDIFPRADWGFSEVYAPTFNAETLTQQRMLESQVYLLPILSGAFFGGGEYLPSVRSLPTLGDDTRILEDLFRIFKRQRQPFFSVYFSSVTHFPYSPPYPFYKEEGDSQYYGPSKYFRFVDPSNSIPPNFEEKQQIRAIYRASLRAFDDAVGRIVKRLKSEGLYDETLIILTSDHGESLFEDVHSHGHGEHLRGEGVTKVPWILKFPKSYTMNARKTGEFLGTTSSVDLVPTILDVLHFSESEKPPELRGLSVLPYLNRGQWNSSRRVYSETGIWFSDRGTHFFQQNRIKYPNILELQNIDSGDQNSVTISEPYAKETIAFSKHRMIQDHKRKLIYVPTPNGVEFECFDRIKDPWNRNPLPSSNCADLKLDLQRTLLSTGKWKKGGDYFLPIQN